MLTKFETNDKEKTNKRSRLRHGKRIDRLSRPSHFPKRELSVGILFFVVVVKQHFYGSSTLKNDIDILIVTFPRISRYRVVLPSFPLKSHSSGGVAGAVFFLLFSPSKQTLPSSNR